MDKNRAEGMKREKKDRRLKEWRQSRWKNDRSMDRRKTCRLRDSGSFEKKKVEGSRPNNVSLTICHVDYRVPHSHTGATGGVCVCLCVSHIAGVSCTSSLCEIFTSVHSCLTSTSKPSVRCVCVRAQCTRV